MIQKLWYANLKFWVRLAIKLFYRRIEIHGLSNFPEKGPVLLAPNHQNAFMDALIPAVFSPRSIHFLVRADVFKSSVARFFFNSVNMMPVYRQRDGIANLAKNEEIFQRCFEILREGKVLLIFPEAGHLGVRKLRPLSKGFTRIAFGALEEHEEIDLKVIPLGLNYNNYHQSQSRLLVNYGSPISVNDYLEVYRKSSARAMSELRSDLFERLAGEIVHIEDEEAMKAFEVELERVLPFYLDRSGGYSQPGRQHHFYKMREKAIQNIRKEDSYYRRIFIYDQEMEKRRLRAPFFFISNKDAGFWVIQNLFLLMFLPLFILSWIIHAPSYFTVRQVLKKYVSDKQFHSSIKLVGMIVLVPLFGIVMAAILAGFSGRPLLVAFSFLLFYPLSVFVIRELRLPYRYCLTMWRILLLKWRKPDLSNYLKQIESDILYSIKCQGK